MPDVAHTGSLLGKTKTSDGSTAPQQKQQTGVFF